MLSEDLLGELQSEYGQSDECLVISGSSSSRKKQKIEEKEQKRSQPREEIEQIVKKISKKKQKKIDQIQKRKERELKQSEYLNIIRTNQLTATERDLMTSTRALNQQLTLKQLLSLLLKKERAGIPLTREERNILYTTRENEDLPNQTLPGIEENFTDKVSSPEIHSEFSFNHIFQEVESKNVVPESGNKKRKQRDSENSEFIESEQLSTSSAPDPAESNNQKQCGTTESNNLHGSVDDESDNFPKKKKNRLAAKRAPILRQPLRKSIGLPTSEQCADVPKPDEEFVEKKTLGQLLMEKFKNLSSKAPPSTSASSTEHQIELTPNHEDDDADWKHEHSGKKYEEIKLPVNSLGQIQLTEAQKLSMTHISTKSKDSKSLRRPHDVVSARMNLPVAQMEQEIVEAINLNDVIILCGETGSGKSTQVPQFLYEYGYADNGLIGVAQPRRVAVVSTADRVNYEMCGEYLTRETKSKNKSSANLVGYQIRYDSHTITPATRVKFMTDGILLREVTGDILLRSYSVILLDEAHERNVNTDILLGLLSRAIPLRKRISEEEKRKFSTLSEDQRKLFIKPLEPLKLIIMSATIRVEDFQNGILFPESIPPIITVPSRQYPVISHFAKRTEMKHYLKETFKKIIQIHTRLPSGGILVFLTGKQEILYMCRKLQGYFRKKQNIGNENELTIQVDDNKNDEQMNDIFNDEQAENEITEGQTEFGDHELSDLDDDDDDDDVDDNDEMNGNDSDDEVSVTDPLHKNYEIPQQSHVRDNQHDLNSENGVRNQMLAALLGNDAVTDKKPEVKPHDIETVDKSAQIENPSLKPVIYPLFAMMSPKLQERVFKPVPEGYRLIVVATNVAETSITIPNITYVVDCGRCKEKVVISESDGAAGITKYEINWISKASADQRQGRAGRTGPGHCYRLYSANFYHQYMKPFVPPEITVSPLEDVVLQMASIGIKEISSFPFPTNPPKKLVQNAIKLLENLGALLPSDMNLSTSDMPQYLEFIKRSDEIQKMNSAVKSGELSEIGRLMSLFPIHPRFAKILVSALFSLHSSIGSSKSRDQLQSQVRLVSFILTLIAAIAERSVFNLDRIKSARSEEDSEEEQEEDAEAIASTQKLEQALKEDSYKLFCHESGDSLALLRAVGAYIYKVTECAQQKLKQKSDAVNLTKSTIKIISNQYSEELQTFCSHFNLQEVTLKRILDLRHQLQVIVESMLPKISFFKDLSSENFQSFKFPSPQSPPSDKEELLIRQLLLSGYSDQIAKKLPVGLLRTGNKRKRFTAYITCNPMFYTKEMLLNQSQDRFSSKKVDNNTNNSMVPLYIHPSSNLFPNNPLQHLPEYVMYHNIIMNQSKTTYYMTNVTVIDEKWIINIAKDSPLLSYGDILTSPQPFYDATMDEIFCYVTPKYGNPAMSQLWELSTVKKPMIEVLKKKFPSFQIEILTKKIEGVDGVQVPLGYRKQDEIYRWFAKSFLEGLLFPELQSAFAKENWKEIIHQNLIQSKMNAKMAMLLKELVQNQVYNRKSFLHVLQTRNSSFLLPEILQFTKNNQELKKFEFEKKWKELRKHTQ